MRWSRSAAVSRTRRGPARGCAPCGALERVVWRGRPEMTRLVVGGRPGDFLLGLEGDSSRAARLTCPRKEVGRSGSVPSCRRPQAPAMAALAAPTSARAAAQASSGVGRARHGVDERAADDDAVGEAGHAGRLLRRRDAEAHRERRVRALAQAREQRRQLGADLGAGAGDAGHGDAVDEARWPRRRRGPAARRCSSASPWAPARRRRRRRAEPARRPPAPARRRVRRPRRAAGRGSPAPPRRRSRRARRIARGP